MKSNGQYLFDSVIRKLQLLEADYFDLEYTDDDIMPVCTQYMLIILII